MLARPGGRRRRPGSSAGHGQFSKKNGGQNPARRSAPSRQRIKCTAEILERAERPRPITMLARPGGRRRRPGSSAGHGQFSKKNGGQNPARRSAPSRQRIKCTAEILERANVRDPSPCWRDQVVVDGDPVARPATANSAKRTAARIQRGARRRHGNG